MYTLPFAHTKACVHMTRCTSFLNTHGTYSVAAVCIRTTCQVCKGLFKACHALMEEVVLPYFTLLLPKDNVNWVLYSQYVD